MTRSGASWALFLATRAVGLALDTAALALSYWSAVVLRFDFRPPRWGWRGVAVAFAVVSLVHLAALVLCGCYRLPWRRISMRDLPRYILATMLACAVLTAVRYFTPLDDFAHMRPPYSVTLMTFVLASISLAGWRIVWSWLSMSRSKTAALLDRSVRRMDATIAARFISGKTVMVTGAGGTIGSELVRQVALASSSAQHDLVPRLFKISYRLSIPLGHGFIPSREQRSVVIKEKYLHKWPFRCAFSNTVNYTTPRQKHI